jgi:hypothetical protein
MMSKCELCIALGRQLSDWDRVCCRLLAMMLDFEATSCDMRRAEGKVLKDRGNSCWSSILPRDPIE